MTIWMLSRLIEYEESTVIALWSNKPDAPTLRKKVREDWAYILTHSEGLRLANCEEVWKHGAGFGLVELEVIENG